MRMKSAFSSDSVDVVRPDSRDAELMEFVRSVLEAAGRHWGDGLVTEPNLRKGELAELYTETHYALAAVLLSVLSGKDRQYLDVAAARLRLWNDASGPMTFFNAMAVCLAAIVVRQSGTTHAGLNAILTSLLARAREHRHVGFGLNCGNNAYLQQVAIDTVLLPLAREEQVTQAGVDNLLAEFERYRTSEGFFFDLPRIGTEQERLSPPAYVMKMLFLVGICHELHPSDALARVFREGMESAAPLLTREGHLAYFGRTDNSPFAAGLTIFNLRKASRAAIAANEDFDSAGIDAERHYLSFPRTSTGMIRSNRFTDPTSLAELNWSRDVYSYEGQYSLASCAYALLGCFWFPEPTATPPDGTRSSVVASSADLGVARLRSGNAELLVRTSSEPTSWDRRYLGPTILRFQIGDRLLVGAISRTVATDAVIRPPRASNRMRRIYDILRDRLVRGIEQLDGTSVGFLPVMRRGSVDYLPYRVVDFKSSPSCVRVRYQMLRLHVRGYRLVLREVRGVLREKARVFGPKYYTRPLMKQVESIELSRTIYLESGHCRIEDTLSGDLAGKTLLFSTRHMPGAIVRVRGLEKRSPSVTGWGSDGRQTLMTYEQRATGSEIRYECDIEPADQRASGVDSLQ